MGGRGSVRAGISGEARTEPRPLGDAIPISTGHNPPETMPRVSTQPLATPPIQGRKELTRQFQRAPGFPEIVAALKNGRSATIDGAWGSASALTAAALGLHAPTTLVILIAHVGDVDDFRDDVATFAGAVPEVF